MPVATLKEEYEQRKKARPDTPESASGRDRVIRLFERLIPIFVPVAAGLWAVVLFTSNRSEVVTKEATEQAAQSRARLVEAQKPFIEHQFNTYRDLTKLLGQLLVYNEKTGERERWEKNYDDYLRVITGPMHFVESDAVRQAVNAFNVDLENYRREGGWDFYRAAQKSGETLIVAMKNDLKSSWTTGDLGTKK
jgi:hypothetical protein